MTYIRCTRKLLKLLKVEPVDLEPSAENSPLGNWHANLIWIERKKCILFTNEKTLFGFLGLDVRAENLKDFAMVFRVNFQKALDAVDIFNPTVDKILKATDKILIAKTTNRSVLGAMNDYAYQYKVHILHGNKGSCLDINQLISRKATLDLSHFRKSNAVFQQPLFQTPDTHRRARIMAHNEEVVMGI